MHVLVCDDDNATRFAVKRMLTQHLPCTVSECGDGVQALKLIGRERFAFILLDVEMPAMSGIEVLELLRESPSTKDLRSSCSRTCATTRWCGTCSSWACRTTS